MTNLLNVRILVAGLIVDLQDHLLSEAQLSEKEKVKLSIVQLLCRWCCHGSVVPVNKSLESQSPRQLRESLWALIDSEHGWDVNAAYDLHTVNKCISTWLKLHF